MQVANRDFSTPRFLASSMEALQAFAGDAELLGSLEAMSQVICNSLRAGGKLLVAGNGGSAADAQHIAGEFISRLMYDRAPLAALALTTDSSVMTATGNDYAFDQVFSRQVRGLGAKADVFLAISTSGNSTNIVSALKDARALGISTLGFTGSRDGKMTSWCDQILRAPSTETAIIQQLHIVAAHVLCARVEEELCPRLVVSAERA